MELCRLCLCVATPDSANFIFTPQTDTYLKIVACLPLKISKTDKLPKNVCSACLAKVDEFFNFCRTVIDVENRLNSFENESKDAYFDDNVNIPDDFPENLTLPARRSIFKYDKIIINVPLPVDDKTEVLSVKSNIEILTNSVETQTDEWCPTYIQDIKIENAFKSENVELPFDVAQYDNVNCKTESLEFSSTTSKKNKKSKNKKHKSLKVRIRKNALNYCVSAEDISDSEDKISLKELQSLKIKEKNNRDNCVSDHNIKSELSDMDDDYDMDMDNGINIKKEDDASDDVWNCCVCFERCFTKRDMLSHYRTHSIKPENSPYDDNYSGPSLNMDNKLFCSNCNKIFYSKESLTKHLLIGCKSKPYRCTLCEKTFKTPHDILKHGVKFHNASLSTAKSEFDVNSMGKRFMCDMCDEVFVYMKYLMLHRNLKHPEMRGKSLINRCLHCRREFTHLNSLRRHLRSHSGEKNFLCNMCGKSLSSREHLKFHIRIHTGFKPNICKTCGKGFVKKCNLTLHERVHSGERPHVCSHCGKAFSQKSTLVIHERYHSGARPYVCTICSKGFVAKGLLSMHLKTCCV